jgi:hypothetical protein
MIMLKAVISKYGDAQTREVIWYVCQTPLGELGHTCIRFESITKLRVSKKENSDKTSIVGPTLRAASWL